MLFTYFLLFLEHRYALHPILTMHVWLGRSVTPFNISVAFGKLYHSIGPWTTSRPGLNWLEMNLNIRFRQILTFAFHAVYIYGFIY